MLDTRPPAPPQSILHNFSASGYTAADDCPDELLLAALETSGNQASTAVGVPQAPFNNERINETALEFPLCARDERPAAVPQAPFNNERINETALEFPLCARDERPAAVTLDEEAANSWTFPGALHIREYQFNIVRRALTRNTLVCLPTGLGKTLIAAVVMLNYMRWYPDGIVVFVAPTRPLVHQQMKACYQSAGIAPQLTAELTGHTRLAARRALWHSRRVFFSTPQVMLNDVLRHICPVQRIVCVVFDEAHRATGRYAYCGLVSEIERSTGGCFRVLALTATPGSSANAIQQVIHNLRIAHLEFRQESDPDVLPYTYERQVRVERVPLDAAIAQVLGAFQRSLASTLQKLCAHGAFYQRNPEKVQHYQLVIAQRRWIEASRRQQTTNVNASRTLPVALFRDFAHALLLSRSVELLRSQGLGTCVRYLEQERTAQAKGNPRSPNELTRRSELQELHLRVKQLLEHGTRHPKIERCKELVVQHFLRHGSSASTRVMIFVQYRDVVAELEAALSQAAPTVRPASFIGQANSGMTQADQHRIMRLFRQGALNCLVSTSIGEEGLDIGHVDLIISFDALGSPIRMLQRMGRTARARAGQVIVLVSESAESQRFEEMNRRANGIAETLRDKYSKFKFFKESPLMLPAEGQPIRCQVLPLTAMPALESQSQEPERPRGEAGSTQAPPLSPRLERLLVLCVNSNRSMDWMKRRPLLALSASRDTSTEAAQIVLNESRSIEAQYRVRCTSTTSMLWIRLHRLVQHFLTGMQASEVPICFERRQGIVGPGLCCTDWRRSRELALDVQPVPCRASAERARALLETGPAEAARAPLSDFQLTSDASQTGPPHSESAHGEPITPMCSTSVRIDATASAPAAGTGAVASASAVYSCSESARCDAHSDPTLDTARYASSPWNALFPEPLSTPADASDRVGAPRGSLDAASNTSSTSSVVEIPTPPELVSRAQQECPAAIPSSDSRSSSSSSASYSLCIAGSCSPHGTRGGHESVRSTRSSTPACRIDDFISNTGLWHSSSVAVQSLQREANATFRPTEHPDIPSDHGAFSEALQGAAHNASTGSVACHVSAARECATPDMPEEVASSDIYWDEVLYRTAALAEETIHGQSCRCRASPQQLNAHSPKTAHSGSPAHASVQHRGGGTQSASPQTYAQHCPGYPGEAVTPGAPPSFLDDNGSLNSVGAPARIPTKRQRAHLRRAQASDTGTPVQSPSGGSQCVCTRSSARSHRVAALEHSPAILTPFLHHRAARRPRLVRISDAASQVAQGTALSDALPSGSASRCLEVAEASPRISARLGSVAQRPRAAGTRSAPNKRIRRKHRRELVAAFIDDQAEVSSSEGNASVDPDVAEALRGTDGDSTSPDTDTPGSLRAFLTSQATSQSTGEQRRQRAMYWRSLRSPQLHSPLSAQVEHSLTTTTTDHRASIVQSGASSETTSRHGMLAGLNEPSEGTATEPVASSPDTPCYRCGRSQDPERTLLCDRCDIECHTYCCDPPYASVPSGSWYCPRCEAYQRNVRILVHSRNLNHPLLTAVREQLARSYPLSGLVPCAGLEADYVVSPRVAVFFLGPESGRTPNREQWFERLERAASRYTRIFVCWVWTSPIQLSPRGLPAVLNTNATLLRCSGIAQAAERITDLALLEHRCGYGLAWVPLSWPDRFQMALGFLQKAADMSFLHAMLLLLRHGNGMDALRDWYRHEGAAMATT